jgi:hypothetical protein
MSRQKSHTPRSLCKSLKQMHQIAKSMHYQSDFSYEDNRLDINDDFRPKGVDK